MSVKVMDLVWELDIPSNEKLVLLEYADHAEHDGSSIFPAVATVARRTGYCERSVQQITRVLARKGLLVADGKGSRGTNKWRVGGAVFAPAASAIAQNHAGGGAVSTPAEIAPLQNDAASGAVLAPAEPAGVQDPTEGDAQVAPAEPTGVQPAMSGGADATEEQVKPVAPDPSLTVIDSSSRVGLSQTEKDQANSKVTAMIENAKKPTYLNRDKIPEQYHMYADTYNALTGQEPTKRVLHHWLQTFSEWVSEGIRPEHVRQAYKESEGRFTVTRPGSLTNTAAALKAKGKSAKSTMHDEAIRETQRLLAENDGHRARRALPPPGLREKVHAVLQKQGVKAEA